MPLNIFQNIILIVVDGFTEERQWLARTDLPLLMGDLSAVVAVVGIVSARDAMARPTEAKAPSDNTSLRLIMLVFFSWMDKLTGARVRATTV